MELSDQVVRHTRNWLEQTVIGLNLCPFAHKPYRQDRISYRVSSAVEEQAVYRDLLVSLDDFLRAGPEVEETGLFICPNCFADFLDYNDFLAVLDELLEQADLQGVVQIASFHPDYVFADADKDDAANFTNRSPYPMFHFIREDLLESALQSHPNPDGIPERNIALLRKLGFAVMQERLAQIRSQSWE